MSRLPGWYQNVLRGHAAGEVLRDVPAAVGVGPTGAEVGEHRLSAASKVIGQWFCARANDGSGWFVVEVTGPPRDGRIPCVAVRVGLTEAAAKALCERHNGARELE